VAAGKTGETPISPESASSPWIELWRATWNKKGARAGLGCMAFFAAIALLAPFLAHRLPLLWIDAGSGAWSSPFFREFFAPGETKESGLDAVFNFSVLFLPLAFLAWRFSGKRWPSLRHRRSRSMAFVLAALLAGALWQGACGILAAVGGSSPWYSERHPSVDPDDILDPPRVAAYLLRQPDGHPGRERLTELIRSGQLLFFRPEAPAIALSPDAGSEWEATLGEYVRLQAERPVRNRRDREDADLPFRQILADTVNHSLRDPAYPIQSGWPERGSAAWLLAARMERAEAPRPDDGWRLRRHHLDSDLPTGSLRPARELNAGLVVAAAAAALALAGVTAILFMAAGQWTADWRWAALLGLALLLAVPFRWSRSYNETRRFRELAAAGRGSGLFTLFPYGPAEVGFGPKLPPHWAQPPVHLALDDILPGPAAGSGDSGWDRLADWLAGMDADSRYPSLRAHLRDHVLAGLPDTLARMGEAGLDSSVAAQWPAFLDGRSLPDGTVPFSGGADPPDGLAGSMDDESSAALLGMALYMPSVRLYTLDRLNRAIDGDDFRGPISVAALDPEADYRVGPYLDARSLDPLQRARMNRLLFDMAVPGVAAPARASHWKNPGHKAGRHWLGTDGNGRDVLSRLIHGSRVSLSVGLVAVTLSTLIGLVLGALAAYHGGWVDHAIMRTVEIMMCIPTFFLILAMIAVLENHSIVNIMLVLGLTGWTGTARLVRGEMLAQRELDYVAAARALGASDTRVIFRHILPNAVAPVLVSVTFGVTGAILSESGLSFLGLGVMPPTPSWGQLLAEARESPATHWWLALFPGLALFLTVFSCNLVGDSLRDALDPRSR